MRSLNMCLFLAVATLVASPGTAAEGPTISELFPKVDGAVVEIATIQQVVADQGPARRVSSGGLGSGFLISSDGQIVTAAHVVQVADEVSVRFVTGDVVRAKVVASARNADVALIKAESVPAGIEPVGLVLNKMDFKATGYGHYLQAYEKYARTSGPAPVDAGDDRSDEAVS